MKQITDRNTNIELLRLLCMLMIFVCHILVHGYSLKNVDGELIAINNIQLILLSVLSPATYCFMFISGWYGITYSKKRLMHILYLCFTAIAISLLVKFIFLGGGYQYFVCHISINKRNLVVYYFVYRNYGFVPNYKRWNRLY